MKVRIQQGQCEIEVDGDQAEVEAILDKWWTSTPAIAPANDDADSELEQTPSKRRQAKRKTPRSPSTPRESVSKINAEEVANRIREHPNFTDLNARFILGDAARGERAKFVAWSVGDLPITSGDVHRVMQALGVKFDAATATRAIGDSKNEYIKDSTGPQTTYRLTTAARHASEQKLNVKPAA